MALTRVTRTVVASNLISSALIANNAIEGRHIADATLTVAHLDSQANALAVETRVNANLNQNHSNALAIESRRASNVTEQTAIEARRVANIAGAVSTITTGNLTADRALISSGAGKVAVSAVTATELSYLDDVTSSVQTQINALETRRAANLTAATFTGQVNMSDDLVITGNLTVSGISSTVNTTELNVKDRMIMLATDASGGPTLDVGFLFNRGNQGNAAFFYDESASTFKLSDVKDPLSNTALSPVTQSNLDVGILTAASLVGTAITQNGATLDNLIGSNVDGAISTVNDTNLTASRALASSGSGKIEVSAVTSTELGYLDGVSSAIQTQLDAKIATTAANSNDFVTFTRLDANLNSTTANINIVQNNVAAIADGATLFVPHTNTITSIVNSNTYGVGAELKAIANVLSVTIDGVTQVPTTDYLYIDSGDKIQFKDVQTSFPAGLVINIVGFKQAS